MATWGAGISLKGVKGDAGTAFLTGAGAPSMAGVEGQGYIDTTAGDLYRYSSGSWTKTRSLIGPMGLNGINGSFYAGTGVPDSTTYNGTGAAIYIRANGEVYLYQGGGTWQDTGENLTGPAGAPGAAGSAGLRGTQTYTGHGAPSSTLSSFSPPAVAGDLYYDLDGGPTLYVLS